MASHVEYTHQLKRFSRDWRMLFSLYGYEREGVQHYGGLIETAAHALQASPTRLLTASNQQDVCSIFLHRVLDAALEPAGLEDYLSQSALGKALENYGNEQSKNWLK